MSRPLIERLTSLRNDLARIQEREIAMYAGSCNVDVTRMLDSIAENAVHIRGVVDFGLTADRRPRLGSTRLMKRVRKALGYTYP